jgi:hypothetical protein
MADVRFVCVIRVYVCPVRVPAPPGDFLPVCAAGDRDETDCPLSVQDYVGVAGFAFGWSAPITSKWAL